MPHHAHATPWTDAEDAILTQLWVAGVPGSEIARRFPDRSRGSIGARAARLNLPSRAKDGKARMLRPARRHTKWTAEDDALILSLRAQGLRGVDIAERLGRTPANVKNRAKRLGMPAHPHSPEVKGWKSHEDDILRRGWAENRSFAEIAALLPGRTDRAVQSHANAIGLPPRRYLNPLSPMFSQSIKPAPARAPVQQTGVAVGLHGVSLPRLRFLEAAE